MAMRANPTEQINHQLAVESDVTSLLGGESVINNIIMQSSLQFHHTCQAQNTIHC